jgi:hypothetical protein
VRFCTLAENQVKMAKFELNNTMKPAGDQPAAIQNILKEEPSRVQKNVIILTNPAEYLVVSN